jgi:hypothetical protein
MRKGEVLGFEVLTPVVMNISIFWDIMLYSPLKINRCFEETERLHLQDRIICPTRNQLSTCFHAGALLSFFFNREYEEDMFLRNVG